MSPSERRRHESGCPIAFALGVFGDRWTLLVLRDLIFMRKRRFSEFAASSEGIATNVLSDRLQRLEDSGLIESAPDPDDRRRVIYSLTDKGLDLIPALVEIVRWGAHHDPDTAAPQAFIDRADNEREALIRDLRDALVTGDSAASGQK